MKHNNYWVSIVLILTISAIVFANNDYFESSTYHVVPGTRARSADFNNTIDAIEAGFDKLPGEDEMRSGTELYAVDTGSADTYQVSLPYYTALTYTDGMLVTFKAANTNTGASTLNVNSIGATSITRQDGSTVVAADIVANKIVSCRYNITSSNFEISTSPANGTGTMASQNANNVSISGGIITGISSLLVSDPGTTTSENPLDITVPNMLDGGTAYTHIGIDTTGAWNSGVISYYHYADNDQDNNLLQLGVNLDHTAVKINGQGNVGINAAPDVSGGGSMDKLTVGGTVDAYQYKTNGYLIPYFVNSGSTITTTVASTSTQIQTLDLGTVAVGDVFFVQVQVIGTKGATGGGTNIDIDKYSGTGAVSIGRGQSAGGISQSYHHEAGTLYAMSVFSTGYVTTAGTLVIDLAMTSAGSDMTLSTPVYFYVNFLYRQ